MLYHPVKIGNLFIPGNLFFAPVAGYSDRAARSVAVQAGADFCYTEMVSAEALVRGSGKTEELMQKSPDEKLYGVQIFGSDPLVMARGACLVLDRTQTNLIDINAGCPVPKIVKTGAGSTLTRYPEKLYEVVKSVVDAVEGRVPVTVKIRSGWDEHSITWKEAADAAVRAGAAGLTLHARTRAQGYEGKADWQILSELVCMMDGKIPVFGSGDAFTPEDAFRMLEQTHCDAVMFARGAIHNPFIFQQTRQFLETGSYEEIPVKIRLEAGFRELDLLCDDKGEDAACREMRKRFCSFSKGISGGAKLRAEIIQAATKNEYMRIFRSYLE